MKNKSKKELKAQIQIQEMAFVLVALILFFALLLLAFSLFQTSKIKEMAYEIRKEKIIAKLKTIALMPEIACRDGLCIDEDKLNGFLKLPETDKKVYEAIWKKAKIALIKIERVWPVKEGKCNEANYPECKTYLIFESGKDYEAYSTFLPLCFYSRLGFKCNIGKIIVGFETPKIE